MWINCKRFVTVGKRLHEVRMVDLRNTELGRHQKNKHAKKKNTYYIFSFNKKCTPKEQKYMKKTTSDQNNSNWGRILELWFCSPLLLFSWSNDYILAFLFFWCRICSFGVYLFFSGIFVLFGTISSFLEEYVFSRRKNHFL